VRIPVSVKMRRGLRPGDMDPAEVARRFEGAGAALITIHPRAAAEEYAGTADHSISARVVEAVDVPVVISGDITDAADALDVLGMTGAAAVMIGRAALGNPWALGAIARGEPDPRPAAGEVIGELEHFARDTADLMGEDRACHYLRKFHSWYLAGRGLPEHEVQALMEDATLDAALARLDALRAALPATAGDAAA